MKNTIKAVFLFLLCVLILSACRQPISPVGPATITHGLKLSVEEYSLYVPWSGTDNPPPLRVTVTNSGNWTTKAISVVVNGENRDEFGVSTATIPSLPAGGSAQFEVRFPEDRGPQPRLLLANILVGNEDAAKKLSLQFGLYDFQDDSHFSIDTPLLQLNSTHTALVQTVHPDKAANIWISTNGAVATIDENGALLARQPGDSIVGFISHMAPFTITGKMIRVYPAVQPLQPVYPQVNGLLRRLSGKKALPVNGAAIAAVAAGGTAVFTKTGGDGVISTIDPNNGELQFSGADTARAPITVSLAITKTVTEGTLTTHQGASSFDVQIGAAPPPEVVSITKVPSPPGSTWIDLVFSDYIQHGGNAKDGFTIAKNGVPLTIASAAITTATIRFVINEMTAYSDNLTVSYNAGSGSITNGETALASFSNRPVIVEGRPPVAEQIVLDGTNPDKLVISYDRDIATTSGFGGFSVSGATGIDPTAAVVSGRTLTLTLSRAPIPQELTALRLSYNAAGGTVADLNGVRAENFTNATITVQNGNLFVGPPVVDQVVIDHANPTTITVRFDKAVLVSNSVSPAAGFALTGSLTTTSIIGVSGSGTDTLSLTINRKPAYAEFGEGFRLSYNPASGNLKDNASPVSVVMAFNEQISQTGFTDGNSTRPAIVNAVVDAMLGGGPASYDKAKKLTVTYNKNVWADSWVGFTLSGSATANTFVGDITVTGSNTLVLTLINAPHYSEEGTFTLSYNQDQGSVRDSATDTNATNVAVSGSIVVNFVNFDPGMGEVNDTTPPWIKSATIQDGVSTKVRVVFSEPVSPNNLALFQVKVNDMPWKPLTSFTGNTQPHLDIAADPSSPWSITNAAAVAGSNDTIWDLTMSTSAQHGEILRLATSAAGAFRDKASAPNALPQFSQFIVRNMVKRIRNAYENTPGLYKNGVPVDIGTGAENHMYNRFLSWLSTTYGAAVSGSENNGPDEGDLFILVLPGAQTQTVAFPFSSYQYHKKLLGKSEGATFIITTPLGNGSDMVITVNLTQVAIHARNGMSWVIEEHVVFERHPEAQTTPHSSVMIYAADGGKLILDGGVIRNNNIQTSGADSGAVRMGGGSYGALFIMNSGKITNNKISRTTTNDNVSLAGGLSIDQYGVFVMHGGEISNNLVHSTNTYSVQAGAVVGLHAGNSAQNHATSSFFMTGGEIKGNRVTSTGARASAGGVVVSGTFQKVGGTIYGSTGDASLRNTTAMSGNVKPGAAAVLNGGTDGVNPTITSGFPPQAYVRGATSNPDMTLFVDSYKTSNSAAGTNSVPPYPQSYWDNQ